MASRKAIRHDDRAGLLEAVHTFPVNSSTETDVDTDLNWFRHPLVKQRP